MDIRLSEEQWEPIDGYIFRGWTINAVKAIRKFTGLGIREAVDIAEERRSMLRERKPEKFVAEQGFDDYKSEHLYA